MHWLDVTRPVAICSGVAVGHDRDVVAVLQQADAELEPGLAAPDDRDLRHAFSFVEPRE